MKDLIIPESLTTPRIEFNADSGELVLSGISQPEDSPEFYAPVIQWLSEYFSKAGSQVRLIFKFEYFNTASAKALVEILSLAAERKKENRNVEVSWYYEEYDEDMMDAADIMAEVAGIGITKICI